MKRLAFIILLCAFVMTSCDLIGLGTTSIIGTWEGNYLNLVELTFTFRQNGTFTLNTVPVIGDPFSSSGTYKNDKSTITLTANSETVTYSYTLSSDKKMMNLSMSNEGVSMTINLTKQ